MPFTSLPWIDVSLGIAFLSIIFYLWARYHYGYWKRKGVYSPDAEFPWGHIGKVITGKMNTGVQLGNLYHQNKQLPYFGIFLVFSKTLVVNSLEMIKNVMLKDFQHFTDHGLGMSVETDPLSNHLFNMDGEVWKALRNKLSPTFTSSKMKYMFNAMLECSKEMESYLEQQVMEGNKVDFRDVIAKYNTDIIGSCAFGISTNSFKHPDAEFRKMGKKAFEIDFFKGIKDVMSLFVPSMIKTFKLRLVHKDIEDFFVKTVSETIQYREKNNISRNDFLQLLIDMKKKDEQNGNGKSFSIVDITSQVFLFFVAGFETSSTTTSYALYELAKNPHVQEKLRNEIDTVLEKHGGNITYEAINEMHYLTQVIEESLRMYPPVPFLFRACTKEYVIPDTDIVIEKGTRIIIPIFGIHRDPDIHKNPNQFDPERFSPENKSKMNQFANLAFGEGPRLCIGNRFGIMQSRLGLISTLLKFKVALDDEEPDSEIFFSPKTIILTEERSRYLRITRRDDK